MVKGGWCGEGRLGLVKRSGVVKGVKGVASGKGVGVVNSQCLNQYVTLV